MNVRLLRALVAVATVAAGWLLVNWYLSDERQIERRLTRIQRLVAKTPAESDLAALAAARAISETFSEPFEIRVEPAGHSTSDRSSLIGNVHQYRARSSALAMEISGLQLFFDTQKAGANTFFSARFIADIGDLVGEESYDFRIHWTKRDGDWLIDDVLVSNVDQLP